MNRKNQEDWLLIFTFVYLFSNITVYLICLAHVVQFQQGYFQLTGKSGMECRNSGHQGLFPVDW